MKAQQQDSHVLPVLHHTDMHCMLNNLAEPGNLHIVSSFVKYVTASMSSVQLWAALTTTVLTYTLQAANVQYTLNTY